MWLPVILLTRVRAGCWDARTCRPLLPSSQHPAADAPPCSCRCTFVNTNKHCSEDVHHVAYLPLFYCRPPGDARVFVALAGLLWMVRHRQGYIKQSINQTNKHIASPRRASRGLVDWTTRGGGGGACQDADTVTQGGAARSRCRGCGHWRGHSLLAWPPRLGCRGGTHECSCRACRCPHPSALTLPSTISAAAHHTAAGSAVLGHVEGGRGLSGASAGGA